MQGRELNFEDYKGNKITTNFFLAGKEDATEQEIEEACKAALVKYKDENDKIFIIEQAKKNTIILDKRLKQMVEANEEKLFQKLMEEANLVNFHNSGVTNFNEAMQNVQQQNRGRQNIQLPVAERFEYYDICSEIKDPNHADRKNTTRFFKQFEVAKQYDDNKYYRFGLSVLAATAMCALHRAGGGAQFSFNSAASVYFISCTLLAQVLASKVANKYDFRNYETLASLAVISAVSGPALLFMGANSQVASTLGSFLYFLSISSCAAGDVADLKKPSSYIKFASQTLLFTALSSTLSQSTFINNHPYISFFFVPILPSIVSSVADKVAGKVMEKDGAWLAKAGVATCAICAVAYGTGASKVVTGAVADLLNFPTFAEGLKVAAKYVGIAA